MRILVASNNEEAKCRILKELALQGMECSPGHAVPLELAADRASRIMPELVVLVLSPDPMAGLEALRQTCNTVCSHVLVVGSVSDSKLILRCLHEGANGFLDEAVLENDLATGLTRVKAKQAPQQEPQEPGQVIGFLGSSGGSGSSTLAVNVATVLGQRYGECGLLDLRLSAGDLAALLNLKPTYTVADFCDNLARVDPSMFEQFFVRSDSNVYLLAAPGNPAYGKRVTSKGVQQMLAMLRVRFPYVVADLDQCFGDEQIEALWQSDVILMVLRLDYISLRNARRAMDHLATVGVGLERVRLVVNRYRQPKQLTVAQAEEALGMKILHLVPDDPGRVNQATNNGVPVVLQQPRTSISNSIVNLAISMNGRSSSVG